MVWLFVALFLVVVIVWVLDYLDLFDIVEVIGAVLRLFIAALGLLAAFFAWSARKLIRSGVPANAASDASVANPPRRAQIQTRTMAREARRNKPPA